MVTFIWILQIISAIMLVILILLHSPKGDGIAGIGGASQIFSSQKSAEKWLNKITAIFAGIFVVCTFLLGFGIITILLTTKLINWEYVPKIFLFIQFPWRMLEFSSYFLSVVASVSFCSTIKNVKIIDVLYVLLITVLLTGIFKDRIDYNDEKVEEPKIRNST